MVARDTAALEATGLSKRYGRGRAPALSDVWLRVMRGSITALVGPNAAGKSTLIKTWVAFERPTAGNVAVMGKDPWQNRTDTLKHLSYVPQQPALYRGISAADHLDIAARARRGFDKVAARQHLQYLTIPPGARPTDLSGGQQAQVMLAIALGTRADVLLLDEPVASLDPLARSEFLALVRMAVQERGATVLLSSHVVSDIAQVCDRLVVLGLGQILLDESISGALDSHWIARPDVPLPAGAVAVGSFHDDATLPRLLVRVAQAPADSPVGDGTLLRASLDDIVKGYLAAGRRAPGANG